MRRKRVSPSKGKRAVRIVTAGDVSIERKKGKHFFTVIFEHSNDAILKEYTVKGPYDLVTDGAVHGVKNVSGTKLFVMNRKVFAKRFPNAFKRGSGTKREGCCQFHNNGLKKNCSLDCCPHTDPPNYRCMLHATGNYCSCEARRKRRSS